MKRIIYILMLIILCACTSNPKVTNVVYTLDSKDQSTMTGIGFDVSEPALTVSVIFGEDGPYLCESTPPFTHWVCPINGLVVTGEMSMTVSIK